MFSSSCNDAGLGWSDMEFVELDRVQGWYDGVIARVIGKRDGAYTVWVSRHGAFIPGNTEFSESNGYQSEISGVMVVSVQLLIKLKILSDLADVNCGMNWVVWIVHEVAGRGDVSERGMSYTGESWLTRARHWCSLDVTESGC